jgi:hypothetical protein
MKLPIECPHEVGMSVGMCSVGENTGTVITDADPPLTPTFIGTSVIFMILTSVFAEALTHSVILTSPRVRVRVG